MHVPCATTLGAHVQCGFAPRSGQAVGSRHRKKVALERFHAWTSVLLDSIMHALALNQQHTACPSLRGSQAAAPTRKYWATAQQNELMHARFKLGYRVHRHCRWVRCRRLFGCPTTEGSTHMHHFKANRCASCCIVQ
jgi:hypothetical protein